jgi:hypothetical protein
MLGCIDSEKCLNPGGTVRQLLLMVPPYGEIAQLLLLQAAVLAELQRWIHFA